MNNDKNPNFEQLTCKIDDALYEKLKKDADGFYKELKKQYKLKKKIDRILKKYPLPTTPIPD